MGPDLIILQLGSSTNNLTHFQRSDRYAPAFPDNRPDSSSRSSSHYIAPSDPARELSATGQGAVTSEPEGRALLGKVSKVVFIFGDLMYELQSAPASAGSNLLNRAPGSWHNWSRKLCR